MSMYELIHGSAHSLPTVPDKSIHALMTSPPYFNLRRYEGEQAVRWEEMSYSPMPGLPPITIPAMTAALGNEETVEAYIGHLIVCLREWWRILRDDGTAWVNLSDSFTGSGGAHAPHHANAGISKSASRNGHSKPAKATIPAKNLYMVPARFALAAQADGWFLRSAMPWIKRNGMPESVTDRPSQTIESVFLLAKSEDYFFDMEAVKVQAATADRPRLTWEERKEKGEPMRRGDPGESGYVCNHAGMGVSPTGRNFRSSDLFFQSWQGMLQDEDGEPLALVVNPQPYKNAHFACWPPALVEPMIKASTSAYGVCAKCGAPWERIVEREQKPPGRSSEEVYTGLAYETPQSMVWGSKKNLGGNPRPAQTTGWRPTCACNCPDVVPSVVCDPFAGSGTTLKVALKLGRRAIGVDISEKYLGELVPERIAGTQMEMAI